MTGELKWNLLTAIAVTDNITRTDLFPLPLSAPHPQHIHTANHFIGGERGVGWGGGVGSVCKLEVFTTDCTDFHHNHTVHRIKQCQHSPTPSSPPHIHLCLTHISVSHTQTQPCTCTCALSLSHTHAHSLSLSLSLTHTHTHTLSLSLSHTHTLSLSYIHTHWLTFLYCVASMRLSPPYRLPMVTMLSTRLIRGRYTSSCQTSQHAAQKVHNMRLIQGLLSMRLQRTDAFVRNLVLQPHKAHTLPPPTPFFGVSHWSSAETRSDNLELAKQN